MNLFCAERRMNWALEVDDANDLAARLESMIDMALGGPPQGLMNKLRTLGRLAHIEHTNRARCATHLVRRLC